jgi:hypothetical protein
MIKQLLETDVDQIVCGVEQSEYEEKKAHLIRDGRLTYDIVIKGIGCGGDMKLLFDSVVKHYYPGMRKKIIMCDDDIIFKQMPPSVKYWANQTVLWDKSDFVCRFAFNEGNHFLRQDWKAADRDLYGYMPTLRNKGPVFAVDSEDFISSGGYDPKFHQANDVDIQQRFNVIGDSVVTRDWTYVAGTFQEGGMSAFYGVEESRKKYQANTAFALYEMKRKYPWLWKSSVSFKASGTSAVYRVDKDILSNYRKEYADGLTVLKETGLHRSAPVFARAQRWHLEPEDEINLQRLHEIYNVSQ